MKTYFYLAISQNGSVRSLKNQPSLNWNEISVGMSLDVPDKIFQRPVLQASIIIPEDVVMKTPLNAEVRDNVAEAIEQVTGLKFSIKVEESEEEK